MSYSVTQETFASLASYWKSGPPARWNSIFVLPVWLEVWWQQFRPETELFLRAVRGENGVIGIAPLQVKEKTGLFVGNTDVCDYDDFVVAPGRDREFFTALIDELRKKNITSLELKHLRPDSTVITKLVELAPALGCKIECRPDAVSLEMDLPSTWEEYLASLTSKQRHEVGRKLRRLEEMGKVSYRTLADGAAIEASLDMFLKLFSESRRDKAAFLTPAIESFFRSMAQRMAQEGLLRLGVLELDGVPTAMVMCFDYNGTIYLYNSGYDPQYNYLSAGMLCKVLCIKESIQLGRKKFDFLKGAETYKYHLGGKEVPLSVCRIDIE
ncbi:MAG: GNAT family N-acetyltransferase [Dehalococcoidales bacterium]|nr:GNAT family N-acetyltransferase [Dehalococcoidales bacterium]